MTSRAMSAIHRRLSDRAARSRSFMIRSMVLASGSPPSFQHFLGSYDSLLCKKTDGVASVSTAAGITAEEALPVSSPAGVTKTKLFKAFLPDGQVASPFFLVPKNCTAVRGFTFPGLGGGRNIRVTLPRGGAVCFSSSSSSSTREVAAASHNDDEEKEMEKSDHDSRSEQHDMAIVREGTEKFIVAARELEAGRVIFDRVGGSLSGERSRHSIQIREGLHMEAEGDVIFLNHSCEPNCRLEVVFDGAADAPSMGVPPELDEGCRPYLRVTVREADIRQNEALTIDYNAMEIDMISPFDCLCGSSKCKGRVSGFANLPPGSQKEYIDGRWAAPVASADKSRLEGPPPLVGAVVTWTKRNVLA